MKRGQITVEYLIVLVVMILLFTAISMDLADFSLQNAMHSQTNELIRSSEHALLSSVDVVKYQGSGATRTVSVRSPSDCSFIVNDAFVLADCRAGSFSENYTGISFAAIPVASVKYSCPDCVSGVIQSGETQLVKVVKS